MSPCPLALAHTFIRSCYMPLWMISHFFLLQHWCFQTNRTWTGSSYGAPALPPWFPFWKSIVSPEYWGWQVLESIQLGSTPMIMMARAWGIIECNCWTNTSALQRTLNSTIVNMFISFPNVQPAKTTATWSLRPSHFEVSPSSSLLPAANAPWSWSRFKHVK